MTLHSRRNLFQDTSYNLYTATYISLKYSMSITESFSKSVNFAKSRTNAASNKAKIRQLFLKCIMRKFYFNKASEKFCSKIDARRV